MNITKKEYILAAEAKGLTSSQANKIRDCFKKQNKIVKHDSSYLTKLKKLSWRYKNQNQENKKLENNLIFQFINFLK